VRDRSDLAAEVETLTNDFDDAFTNYSAPLASQEYPVNPVSPPPRHTNAHDLRRRSRLQAHCASITVSFFSMFPFAMINGAMVGQDMDGSDMKCSVGEPFGKYVNRIASEPFPYSPMTSASRNITDVWQGRTFRILWSGSSAWRMARVCGFSQWNMGPFHFDPHWSLRFKLEDLPSSEGDEGTNVTLNKGDRVVVQGLVKACQYNGRTGVVLADTNEEGRYPIQLQAENYKERQNPVLICVKPANVLYAAQKEITLKIRRINIEGGGTLENDAAGNGPLISFEWLEPADPAIDLSMSGEDDSLVTCPTCRAVVDKSANADVFVHPPKGETKEEECPVCLETKECRTLKVCGHSVCGACFTSWHQARTEFIPPVMEPNEVDRLRAERNQRVNERLPHTSGGSATQVGDSEETVRRCFLDAYIGFLQNLAQRLIDRSDDLEHFYRELMVEHVAVWCLSSNKMFNLLEQLSITALKVYMLVSEERMEEIFAFSRIHAFSDRMDVDKEKLFAMTRGRLTCVMGEKLEDDDRHESAIPWYEASLDQAQKQGDAHEIVTAYCNLGLAQKRCGRLQDAKANYEKGLQLEPNTSSNIRGNLETLLDEMGNWIGTSGQLPPP